MESFFSNCTVMKQIYLTSAYLAPINYYAKLYSFPHIVIEQHDHYCKQTYRNRCVIATAEGLQTLTIPTERTGEQKCAMKDTRISSHGHWQHIHWNAIKSAYKNSPFFDYYCDDLHTFYTEKQTFLIDFNQRLQALMCEWIDIAPEVAYSTAYLPTPTTDQTLDYREWIHPKVDFTTDPLFQATPYYQVFKEKYNFQPNLSILDLLFNMGPESLLVIERSLKESDK